jgi:hypothetical protein
MGSCSPPTKPMPKAVKGVLDLRDWDFDSSKTLSTSLGAIDTERNGDGIVKLDGEWEFYWEEFLSLDEMEIIQDNSMRKEFSNNFYNIYTLNKF